MRQTQPSSGKVGIHMTVMVKGERGSQDPPASGKGKPSPKVCIQKSTYKDLDINTLLAPLGGMEKFVSKGDRVLLKVNLLSAAVPSKAVTTDPAVVEAVAKAVIDAGGVPYIGDSPGGPFSKFWLGRAYKASGFKELADRLGIDLNYDTGSREVDMPKGQVLKRSPICNYILDADRIIALPKIKTHGLMVMTLATKIMYGAIPGLTKGKYHVQFMKRPDFANMLLDILTVVKPALYVMDGIIGMDRNGPGSGRPVKIGAMLASSNPYAMDLSVCKAVGVEPLGVHPLKAAKIRGLWPKEIEYPLLSPKDIRYKGFELPDSANALAKGGKGGELVPSPSDKCIACGRCQTICPKGAIKVVGKKARVDYTLCIRCYCCHEICPEDAIDLVRP